MKIHIPFTKYDLHISKRGFTYVKNGQVVSFADWSSGLISTPNTPVLEQIYNVIASEFAKIDLRHVIFKDGQYSPKNDSLNYLVSERPNRLQTKYDFMYTMMYQLYKYGNAIAFIQRDKKGHVASIEPINVTDYVLGNGYQVDDDMIIIKMKDKRTNEILLTNYNNIIHLRLNPNNIFYGDLFTGLNNTQVIVDLVDKSLASLLTELSDSGTVRGIIKVGESGIGYSNGFANRAMMNQTEKTNKQQEIIDRIKSTSGGILVLDAGESWQDLDKPFATVTTDTLDQYINMLLQFNGINKKVVNGEADYETMEIFFNKTIVPRIEQFIGEINYKIFSETSKTQGHRIEYYRNQFEYLPLDKAIDIAYKGAFDTTTNERRRMIYKLPPIENGDILMYNKNFQPFDQNANESEEQHE